MKLNFNSSKTVTEEMHIVTIEGHSWELNDTDAQKIVDILNGMTKVSTVSSTGLVYEEDTPKSTPTKIEGKPLWQEDFCTITCALNADNKKEYRLYITCPVKGEKGKKIRYAIKKSAQAMGARYDSEHCDFNAGKIYWVFKTRKEAEAYANSRKEYAKSIAK